MRSFYFKNVKLLGRILDPIINFVILAFGGIVSFLKVVGDEADLNLMDQNSTSII